MYLKIVLIIYVFPISFHWIILSAVFPYILFSYFHFNFFFFIIRCKWHISKDLNENYSFNYISLISGVHLWYMLYNYINNDYSNDYSNNTIIIIIVY